MQGDDDWVWFVKMRTNNGVDLIYNAKVFGRPASDEVGIWLSYWPIGNSLYHGDEVNVNIVVTKGLVIKGCGASLVYTDEEDEIDFFGDSNESIVDTNDFFEDNKFFEDNNNSFEDNNEHDNILGVDISEFRLSTGTYYLCRRDYFRLMEVGRLSSNWFKNLVGDTIDYTEIGGWRKTGRPDQPYQSFRALKTVGCIIYGPQLDMDIHENTVEPTSSVMKVEYSESDINRWTANADIGKYQDHASLRSSHAIHPRSSSERARRTRISERMKKLQDLVPNVDKQTNTSDMLDLAVDYIKELQKQAEELRDHHTKCTSPHKRKL